MGAEEGWAVDADSLDDRPETAVNAQGFEVDVVRSMGSPHPMRMSSEEGDLWAVRVASADHLLGPARFSQTVVAANGRMAVMHAPDPAAFVRIKRAMAISPHRDPLKRNRDAAQAGIVQDWLDRQLLISSETDQPMVG